MVGNGATAAVCDLCAVAFLVAAFSKPAGAKAMPSHGAVDFGALICFLVGAVLFCVGLLKRSVAEMAVTNKRVIVKTGLAQRRTTEILLSRIESVVVDEPAMGRILGYGTGTERGTGATAEVFEKIQHPLKFREQVQSQIARGPQPA